MQVEKAFSYQFEDPEWVTKLALGALISLVPILNLAVVGYMVSIIRNLAARAERPLPQWDEFGKKWLDGLMLALAGLVYAAPALIALSVPVAMLIASGAVSSNSNMRDVGTAMAGAGGVLLALGILLLILYSLVLSIIRPIILILFSRDGTFASCFRFREMYSILSSHTRAFFLTWLAVLLAGIGIGLLVGFINLVIGWIPCVGWVVSLLLGLGTAIYILTLDAHLFGQFRLEALGAATKAPALPVDEKSQQNPGDLSS